MTISRLKKNSLIQSWLLLVPITIILMVCLFILAPLLAVNPDLNFAQQIFLPYVCTLLECKPEPLEQIRYILAITIVPLTFLLAITILKIIRFSIPSFFRPVALPVVLLIQSVLIAFISVNAQVGDKATIFYILAKDNFVPWLLAGSLVLLGFILFKIAYNQIFVVRVGLSVNAHRGLLKNISINYIPYNIAIFYTLLRLMPSIIVDFDYQSTNNIVSWHIPYSMGEFAAVLNGKTILVNFFPQYQNFLPYILLPIFNIFGLSLTSFSLAMSTLSLIGMMLIFAVYKYLTKSSWIALALYIPYCSLSFFPNHSVGGLVLNAFNYFVVAPLRYFGYWILAFLLARYLLKPTLPRMAILFFIGGIVTINNLDFGIPALVAVLVAVIITTGNGLFPPLKTAFKIGSIFIVSVSLALGLFIFITIIRSGETPNIGQLTLFQRIFAVYGFGMLPMPPLGLHWLIYITFMAAILVGLQRTVSVLGTNDLFSQQRLSNGLLVFSGIAGCGALMYFVGRSHPYVLTCVFPAWAFSLLLLAWEQFLDWRKNFSQFNTTDKLVRYIPTVVLLFLYIIFTGNILTTPALPTQLARLRSYNNSFSTWQAKAVEFVRNQTHTKENIGIIYPYGYEIANIAQVENVFPYTTPFSLILKSQLEVAIKTFKSKDVKHLFGYFPEDINNRLIQEGYHFVNELEPASYITLSKPVQNFKHWAK
jgi:hypothetical protein